MTNLNLDMSQIIAQLKTSFSNILNIFYPFSGNIKDNLFILEFDMGVPFLEARVNCSMSEFLKHLETDLLSLFVLYHAFCKETNTTIGQMAVHLNPFDCGGIAIGLSCSHKVADATTASIFLHILGLPPLLGLQKKLYIQIFLRDQSCFHQEIHFHKSI